MSKIWRESVGDTNNDTTLGRLQFGTLGIYGPFHRTLVSPSCPYLPVDLIGLCSELIRRLLLSFLAFDPIACGLDRNRHPGSLA
jgi:hypothetical protein